MDDVSGPSDHESADVEFLVDDRRVGGLLTLSRQGHPASSSARPIPDPAHVRCSWRRSAESSTGPAACRGRPGGATRPAAQHSKNFGRRIDAERFLITIEARKLAGTYIDPRAGRIRLGEFTEQATAGWVNRRDSTKARDESYLRSLVLPVFADMPIGAISVFDVQEWVSDLDADGYAPATIRKAYQLLGRILNDAVNGGLIARTPCRDVTLPKIEDTEKRFLSPDEITHLADTIDPRYRALVVTAAYTGCRIGELIALDTDRYQPDKRIIRIERSLAEVRGHLRFGQPKTAAARRAVSLPEWLPETIDRHLDRPPARPRTA